MRRRNCPYLGLQYDSSTCHAFPSDHNYCHKVSVPGPVDLAYQEAICLTEDHLDCPIYNGVEQVLPDTDDTPVKRRALRCGCIFGLIAALSVVVALGAPFLTGSSGVRSLMQILGEPTRETFFTPTPAGYVAGGLLASATLSPALPTCLPPAGWVRYTLQGGDDLVAIGNQRGVDLLAIQQGNCNLDLFTLVAGDVIFLPAETVVTPVVSAEVTATTIPTLIPSPTLEPSATATMLPTPTETSTALPTETPTPTITATLYYPPTATQPQPTATRRPRRPTDTPEPTGPVVRPTSTPPPVRP